MKKLNSYEDFLALEPGNFLVLKSHTNLQTFLITRSVHAHSGTTVALVGLQIIFSRNGSSTKMEQWFISKSMFDDLKYIHEFVSKITVID